AAWGFGHTLALLVAGIGVLLLRYQLTDRMAHGFEVCVGIMLVLLGANALRTLGRRGDGDTRGQTSAARHSHAEMWVVARPLLVGMVHGLAGSAPLLLLTLTVVSSAWAGFAYIAVFGVGSIMGMALMSLLVSVPAQLTVERFERANVAVRALSGAFSVL